MNFCEYKPVNERGCLAIFDSNVPFSFAIEERRTFQNFLERLAFPYSYYVIRDDEKIVACGGIKFELLNHIARLRWNMVLKDCQNKGIGTFLTLSRLYLICQYPDIQLVNLYTSQHSYRFYEKMGFVLQKVIPDGIVQGMDEYFMELDLNDIKRDELQNFAKRVSFSWVTA